MQPVNRARRLPAGEGGRGGLGVELELLDRDDRRLVGDPASGHGVGPQVGGAGLGEQRGRGSLGPGGRPRPTGAAPPNALILAGGAVWLFLAPEPDGQTLLLVVIAAMTLEMAMGFAVAILLHRRRGTDMTDMATDLSP